MNRKAAANRRYMEEVGRSVHPKKYLNKGSAINLAKAKFQEEAAVYMIDGWYYAGKISNHAALKALTVWDGTTKE